MSSKKYVYGVVGSCIMLFLLFAALSWFVAIKKDVVLHTILERIYTLHESLLQTTNLTRNNQADSETEGIIKDCDRRAEYEHTLSRLSAGLSAIEMRQALGLYDACGDFFALRKRIMVLKMQMFFDELSVSAQMYQEYSGSLRYEQLIAKWKLILAAETDRAQLLSKQTELQGEIIKTLSENPSADLRDKLNQAQDIAQQLDVQYTEVEARKKEESEAWTQVMSIH